MTPALVAAAAGARAWLLDSMFPLWSSAGFDDRTGQFVEALTPDGEPLPLPRRVLVQARQMVVFCAAGRLGWRGPWRERTTAAAEALLARGRGAGGDWIYSFDASGAAADARRDLYTQAFVILGFSEAGRSLGRTDFIDAARATCEALDARWADPAGGYREGDFAPHPGRQNPHMHLLEAFLAFHAATEDAAGLARAERIADLFMRHVLVAPGQAAEELDADWRVLPEGGAAPGHQFEWAWLLGRLRQAGGRDESSAEEAALAAYGERRGVDKGGFAVDALSLDGAVRQSSARLWPQCERLRAALSRRQHDSGSLGAAEQAAAALGLYLDTPARGAWRDLRLADGGWQAGPAPASSGYHIVGAYEALIDAVRADGGG